MHTYTLGFRWQTFSFPGDVLVKVMAWCPLSWCINKKNKRAKHGQTLAENKTYMKKKSCCIIKEGENPLGLWDWVWEWVPKKGMHTWINVQVAS